MSYYKISFVLLKKGGEKMSKIVVVEGICCSGKSTLVGNLGDTDMGVVKEYSAYTK